MGIFSFIFGEDEPKAPSAASKVSPQCALDVQKAVQQAYKEENREPSLIGDLFLGSPMDNAIASAFRNISINGSRCNSEDIPSPAAFSVLAKEISSGGHSQ